jgi:hypothetical protein
MHLGAFDGVGCEADLELLDLPLDRIQRLSGQSPLRAHGDPGRHDHRGDRADERGPGHPGHPPS